MKKEYIKPLFETKALPFEEIAAPTASGNRDEAPGDANDSWDEW